MIAEMGRVRERHGMALGVKGMGGTSDCLPAAVVNAVADALAPLGVKVSVPLGPGKSSIRLHRPIDGER